NPGPRLPPVRGAGDVLEGGDGTDDCDAHGTLVAGVLAAREDETGHVGVAPGIELVSIRQSSGVLRPTGQEDDGATVGVGVGTISTLAAAIRAAVDAGAGVINISEVACVPAGTRLADDTLGGAIRYAAVEHDVVLVAAAGNVGQTCGAQNPGTPDPAAPGSDGWDDVVTVASPAWYGDHVLTVGGVDADGAAADSPLRRPRGGGQAAADGPAWPPWPPLPGTATTGSPSVASTRTGPPPTSPSAARGSTSRRRRWGCDRWGPTATGWPISSSARTGRGRRSAARASPHPSSPAWRPSSGRPARGSPPGR